MNVDPKWSVPILRFFTVYVNSDLVGEQMFFKFVFHHS